MKRVIVAAAVASFAVIGLTFAVIAQSDVLAGLLNPLVVTIQQAVPVGITVAVPLEDGGTVTSTVPLTVGIDLAITIQGAQVVSAAAGIRDLSVVVQALPVIEEMVDDDGIPYTVEMVIGGFVLSELNGKDAGSDGKFALSGEVRNDGSSEGNVRIAVTPYDAQGNILNTRWTTPALFPLPPGYSSAFIMNPSNADFSDVARYRIQISSY